MTVSPGLTAVILAAGAGSRLGELGRHSSKAMLPVAGQPLIAWVLARLRAAGIARFVVVAHVSDLALASFVGAVGPTATLVRQSERRGIADALRLALPALSPGEAYLACACDSLFDSADIAALIDLGRGRAGAAVVGVLDMGVEATASRSVVCVEGERVVRIVEKPAPGSVASGLVSMPLYWVPAELGGHLETPPACGEHYISTSLAAFLAAGGAVLACPVRRRLEITTPEDVARVERILVG